MRDDRPSWRPVAAGAREVHQTFFLDELTALSAGHRPCWQCQRARYKEFVSVWCEVNGEIDSIKVVDKTLHSERCDLTLGGGKPKVSAFLRTLPSGTMVRPTWTAPPHLWYEHRLFPWSLTGYRQSTPTDSLDMVQVLTPQSIVELLSAGLSLALDSKTSIHPSLKVLL